MLSRLWRNKNIHADTFQQPTCTDYSYTHDHIIPLLRLYLNKYRYIHLYIRVYVRVQYLYIYVNVYIHAYVLICMYVAVCVCLQPRKTCICVNGICMRILATSQLLIVTGIQKQPNAHNYQNGEVICAWVYAIKHYAIVIRNEPKVYRATQLDVLSSENGNEK